MLVIFFEPLKHILKPQNVNSDKSRWLLQLKEYNKFGLVAYVVLKVYNDKGSKKTYVKPYY